MEFKKEDFNWTDESVVGMALIIQGGQIDSNGDILNSNVYYEVGKHKETGQVAIIPTDKNQKHDFINNQMKKTNQFN